MRITLNGKIHRGTVTGADIHYEGSVAIDLDLLEAADLLVYEQVHIFNIDNGQRIVTYVIEGERGSGEITLNGAAARSVAVGDKVIICAFANVAETDLPTHKPSEILVDEKNRIVRKL